jgi:PiT family inorganic phosphate transporter
VGAGAEALSHAIGGDAGIIVVLAILVVIAAVIYYQSRASRVDHNNVNAEWTGSVAPPAEPAQPAKAPA